MGHTGAVYPIVYYNTKLAIFRTPVWLVGFVKVMGAAYGMFLIDYHYVSHKLHNSCQVYDYLKSKVSMENYRK